MDDITVPKDAVEDEWFDEYGDRFQLLLEEVELVRICTLTSSPADFDLYVSRDGDIYSSDVDDEFPPFEMERDSPIWIHTDVEDISEPFDYEWFSTYILPFLM